MTAIPIRARKPGEACDLVAWKHTRGAAIPEWVGRKYSHVPGVSREALLSATGAHLPLGGWIVGLRSVYAPRRAPREVQVIVMPVFILRDDADFFREFCFRVEVEAGEGVCS